MAVRPLGDSPGDSQVRTPQRVPMRRQATPQAPVRQDQQARTNRAVQNALDFNARASGTRLRERLTTIQEETNNLHD